jgi:hypothetical protein
MHGTVDLAFGAVVDSLEPTTVSVVDVEVKCVWCAIWSAEVQKGMRADILRRESYLSNDRRPLLVPSLLTVVDT